MSYVTTVIVFGRYIPSEAQEMLRNGYNSGSGYVRFGSLSDLRRADGDCTPWEFWGGTKGPEADLFGGAFNYLDTERLLEWLRTVPWRDRVAVLVVHPEQENGFDLHTFPEGRDG